MLSPDPFTGFAGNCSDKHAPTLFSDRAEWVSHQREAHKRNQPTPARFTTGGAPITAAERAQLGRWVTYRGDYGQVFSLAPGRNRVWVSFGGSEIRELDILALTDAPAPDPMCGPIAEEPTPEPTPAATVSPAAPQTPRRRTPARPIGHTGTNGAEVAAYWKSIEARYLAAIA